MRLGLREAVTVTTEETLGMKTKSLIWIGVGVGLVGALTVAVLSVVCYAMYQHMSVDHQNLHALTAITQFNLQERRLLPLPQPPAVAPGAVPASPPAPEKK